MTPKIDKTLHEIAEGTIEWCTLDLRGIKVKRAPSYEEWTEFITPWKVVKESLPFIIGDWINIGKEKFGEKFSQALTIFGEYEYQTIMNYASVCARVPFKIRNSLRFGHHAAVAYLKNDKGDPDYEAMRYFLAIALEHQYTVNQLKEFIKERKKEEGEEGEEELLTSGQFHKKAEKICGLLAELAGQVDRQEIAGEITQALNIIRNAQLKYDKLNMPAVEYKKQTQGNFEPAPAGTD